MGQLEGKVVVITGAAGGQGAAEARLARAEGATVVATDLSAPDTGTLNLPLDVTSRDAWEQLAQHLEHELGRVDGLVNNAATTGRTPLTELSADEFERVQRVNVQGPLLGIQTMAPLMPSGSSIVNISSLAGLIASPTAAYTISKWALRGLSAVAAKELGPRGIRVNTVCPGYIESPMTAAAPEAFRTNSVAAAPLRRLGSVDDVAPLVVFLLADVSSYLSGTEIPVDGGTWADGGASRIFDGVFRPAP
jgi:3alpha(or 20beta)-hydroxysteroid dehydrogenase